MENSYDAADNLYIRGSRPVGTNGRVSAKGKFLINPSSGMLSFDTLGGIIARKVTANDTIK